MLWTNLLCNLMSVPITIDVAKLTTHNIKIIQIVHHIQTTPPPPSKIEVPLSQITLQNYLLEIHHGWTLWFQGKRNTRPNVNVNPIVSRLVVILQIPNQMWITMEKNFIFILLCDPKEPRSIGCTKIKTICQLTFLPLVAWNIPYANLENTYHKST